MPAKHLLLALVVVAVWGFNFVMIHLGLQGAPPIFLCTLRFLLATLPAIFFFSRPHCSWRLLLGFGLANFVAQFSFLFLAMNLGLPPGMASLVAQTQVFFSMLLGAALFRERPSAWKITGALISFGGIYLVARDFHGSSLWGLLLGICAAFSWGLGNMFTKKIRAASPLGLVVWGSAVATPVLFLISLAVEGPAAMAASLAHFSLLSLAALAYITYLSTYVGYSIWGFLLKHYPTPVVAPFSLLVPVFGFLGAYLALGEEFPARKLVASAVVVTGLVFNVAEPRLRKLAARAGLGRKSLQ